MKSNQMLTMAIVLLALALCACQQEPLPVPDYPLTAETIEAALAEWGIGWEVQELDSPYPPNPDQSWYTLYDAASDKQVCAISSARLDGERMLSLTFVSVTGPLPAEECEKALICAARLYGGFASERTVADRFLKEYDSVNTTRWETGRTGWGGRLLHGWKARWSRHIDKVACQVMLEQPAQDELTQTEPVPEVPPVNVKSITFASNWDAFFLLARFE